MADEKLSIVEHLEEFRSRVIKSIVFIIAASCLFYNFVDKIYPSLIGPVGKLVFIAPQEAFISDIKIAFFGGIFLSSPFVLYQIWRFIATALTKKERKYTLIFGIPSFLFFVIGAGFGYFVIVPIGMKFLLGFANNFVSPTITIERYISFVGMLTLAFGLVFQLPIVSLFLTKVGIVTPRFLADKRRHAIVAIFVAAAMLTPPDIITQCLMAVPLLLLYEVGILFSKFAYKAP